MTVWVRFVASHELLAQSRGFGKDLTVWVAYGKDLTVWVAYAQRVKVGILCITSSTICRTTVPQSYLA